ncbi:MAG: DEAD/DEAH box helicase [Bacteroidota bacterium]
MDFEKTIGFIIIRDLLASKNQQPFAFQREAWEHIAGHKSGLVNAPTGCGKTFSIFLGSLISFINANPDRYKTKDKSGLQLLWITPLRALAKDIGRAMEEVISELGLQWKVGIRNGDTNTSDRAKQKRMMPEVLIITPESLHLLLAMKENSNYFNTLKLVAVDEWHELLGSKRGVQVELAVNYLVHSKKIDPATPLLVWGISATIGNLPEAAEVLLSSLQDADASHEPVIIRSGIQTTLLEEKKSSSLVNNRSKRKVLQQDVAVLQPILPSTVLKKEVAAKYISVHSIIPDEIEKYPWAGHLGIKLAHKLVPIIERSNTTLIFINTRGMSERWYQTLLDIAPQLAGAIALHHGSIEQDLRTWVEEALHTQTLKAVVCTASLDLGVDFRPVDTVIQVGSPKGVARFLQRAGRAGHQPGSISHIYFLPTHSLELVEATALKAAIQEGLIESREPMRLCFDVLVQYLCTLAVGEGFSSDSLWQQVKKTYCFADMNRNEWEQLLFHITEGGNALQQYDEFKKVEFENGLFKIKSRRMALRHRLHIGTIVSDSMLRVKFMTGGYVGVIEEYFISRLEPGDVFTLAGRNLELIQIKDMTVYVRKSNSKKSLVPSWMGGRMSLTANLGHMLRQTFSLAAAITNVAETGKRLEEYPVELQALLPLFQLQKELSHIPGNNELLIEHIEDKDGFHLMVYPFEGRQVHEAMSAILAQRIGQITPISFSIAMNDYGFELLSDQPIPVDDTNAADLFTTDNLLTDMQRSTNSTEMAMRKFRDIATIGGLIFQGMPGEHKKARHLQSSASLLFKVFRDYDPSNLLLRQAYNEVYEQQMEEVRLRNALNRIQSNSIIITFPTHYTPLSFPILVDGLSRMNLSSEKLEDRIRRMQLINK